MLSNTAYKKSIDVPHFFLFQSQLTAEVHLELYETSKIELFLIEK